MLKKVCLLTNYNLYESKRHFTLKLAEAMQRAGIQTKIIDAREGVLGANIISSIKAFAPDATCSFNSLDPISEKHYLWDFLTTPHISFLVDPAFYSTYLVDSPYSIISCVDHSDVEAIASTGFRNVFFWPHAIEKDLPTSQEDRPYDVVFLGSCYDYESLRIAWRQRHPEAFNKVLDDAIDLVFSDDTISLGNALAHAWQASKLNPEGVDFTTLYYYLDNYTRGKDRVELIRSIKDAHVHVFGELSPDNAVGILSWHQYLASQKNATIHPSVPFPKAMEILRQSKIVLNSMPFFRNGSHERIFTGLGSGCLVISSESQYLRNQFKENEGLLFYQGKDRQIANELVNEWLQNEQKRSAAAGVGRQKVLTHYTWDTRVQQLQQILLEKSICK